MKAWKISLLAVTIILTGCEKKSPDTEKPEKAVKGDAQLSPIDRDHPMARQLDRQSENATLTDMSVAEIHFVPHRAILNGNGTARLYRLAWLVQKYGGTIYVDLGDTQSELSQDRMRIVSDYLVAAGLPKENIHLVFGIPESTGMLASEAITVHNDSRIKPMKDQQPSSVFGK